MFLIVLGIVVSYLAVGAVYARSQSLRLYRQAKERWRFADMVTAPWVVTMLWRALFWPYAIVHDALRGPISKWFAAPVTRHIARVAQLRKDAETWRQTSRNERDPEKRAMAEQLATMLREQADKEDFR